MSGIHIKKIFKNLPCIETERLILRKLKVSDAKDIYEYAKNPQVSKYTMWHAHKSSTESASFLTYLTRNYRKGIPEAWGMLLKENNKIIGTCGFYKIDERCRNGEVGYAMGKDYWGKGLMTEALRAMLEFGFKKIGLHRIQANTKPGNKGSEKVLLKNGFKFEGLMRDSIFAKGQYHDLRVFSILEPEWKKKHK